MSSFVRRIEKRIMKGAELMKRDVPVFGKDGKFIRNDRLVTDKDGESYGPTFPRRIPAQFALPTRPRQPKKPPKVRRAPTMRGRSFMNWHWNTGRIALAAGLREQLTYMRMVSHRRVL